MSDAFAEISTLDPAPDQFAFRNGVTVQVVPLQTRQLFRLLRIITHGAGLALQRNPIDFTRPAGEFGSQLVMMVLISLPDAEEEALQFLRSMCKANLREGRNLNRQDREFNDAEMERVTGALANPDPNDLVDLISLIIERDSENLLDLGKRLWGMVEPYLAKGISPGLADNPSPEDVAQMTETELPDEPPSVQVGSPQRSTSSPASTGGATTRSSPSRSGGSARSSQPSSGAGTPASVPALS